MEVVRTTYGEWGDYLESDHKQMLYQCNTCKSRAAVMKMRTVTEPSGGAHKEFKVVCPICKSKGPVHWNKILAERSWEGQNESIFERPRNERPNGAWRK